MRSIAERFVLGHSAAAQGNYRSAGQAIGISFGVLDTEFAFDANRAIVDNRDLRRHAALMVAEQTAVLTYNCHRGY